MKKDEQKQFIHDLISAVEGEMMDSLPRIPEHWEGIELRNWIADRFSRQVWRNWSKAEQKDYENDKLTLNL